ncbi:hypothetical protein ACHY8Y_002682 [Enterococcus faecalis]|uniref:hypothetical protein n=1 Tax=Enterococcus faecalis TaxID=1351 RepID=UPI00375EF5D7
MKKICCILLFGLGIFYNCENAYADWSPSSGIQAEAVKNWVAKETDKFMNFEGETLGNKVGDKISKEVNFPDYLYVKKYEGENNWNGQWYIQLGANKLVSGSYIAYDNFRFSSSDEIKVSISGSPTDKKRIISVERIKPSKNTSYNIKINYTFSSKGAMYNDFGIISGKYNTITPGGEGAERVLQLNSTPSEDNLTADALPQTAYLGMDSSKFDYSKFVKNVKLGDQVLSSDQYKVELINSLTTDTVGTKTAKIRITLKSDASKTVEIDVPVEVGWGNSVVYGSYDYGANGRTSAAFTLYTESTPTIVASQGQNDDNLAIHSNFPNQQYYTFNWFDLSNKQILKIDESNNGDKYIKASGNELKKDKLKEWGTAQNQAVNYGDIVRAWQTETGKNWLYENEQKQAYNDAKKAVYYEITTSGYRPLHFNQLTPKTGKIPIYSTNIYLDEHVKDYIDLKGYSNIDVKGFVEYPDTTSSGDKRAKILVEETLTTGKKVQYEYEVTINVEPGTLTYTVPKTLTFKEFSKSKSEQIVQRKYSGSLGLLIKDNRGSNKQGNWTLTAKASSDLKGIAPYLIYRNEKGVDSYLNGSAVPVYTQDKQVSATEPLEVEVSNKWKSTDGILLKVPSKNNLASQEYSTTITWNLVEGP